jgi:hypothetical protein
MISGIGDPSLRLKDGSARDEATLDCHEIQTKHYLGYPLAGNDI